MSNLSFIYYGYFNQIWGLWYEFQGYNLGFIPGMPLYVQRIHVKGHLFTYGYTILVVLFQLPISQDYHVHYITLNS